MKVLVGCEESQAVCIAFREKGHEAYSCDVQPCSGGHPEWHLQGDILDFINDEWDLMICHPPCTYFSAAGMHYLKTQQGRIDNLKSAFILVDALWTSRIPKIALENPVGWLNTNWKKPSQIIEPYYFGDNERKKTCLWLKGLPRLNGKVEVAASIEYFKPKPDGLTKPSKDGYRRGIYFCGRINSANRNNKAAKLKSKTFPGIARAMADQWGRTI